MKEQGRQLRQSIGLFQAVMYGVGLILGAGIYVLIGDIAGVAGNAMWLSFIAAAVIAAFTGLSYAELSSAFPKSAAEYVFVKNAFGNNLLAFVTGWLIIFVAVASASAVAIGFSGYLLNFIPQADRTLSAALLIAGLSAINFIGIRESAWMNTIFTIVELLGLVIIIALALFFGFPANYFEMPPAILDSSMAAGAILGAAGLIFFAYFGFENLANIAEETKNPKKTIPAALILSIIITTIVYILVAVSAVSLVGWESLSSTDAPLSLAAEKVFGKTGAVMLSVIALFATTNTVLMLLVSGSRIIFGMASDRALPHSLSCVHKITRTPYKAIVAVMVVAIIIVAVSAGSIEAVAKVAVFGIFVVYAFVSLSLIWLRYKQPGLDRQFKSPIQIGKFPVLAGLGLAASIIMLTQFDWMTAVFGSLAFLSAIVCFAVWRRSLK